MKTEVVNCGMHEGLEDKLNKWMKDNDWPVVEFVTHVIHANTHWITIWYLEAEKKTTEM